MYLVWELLELSTLNTRRFLFRLPQSLFELFSRPGGPLSTPGGQPQLTHAAIAFRATARPHFIGRARSRNDITVAAGSCGYFSQPAVG